MDDSPTGQDAAASPDLATQLASLRASEDQVLAISQGLVQELNLLVISAEKAAELMLPPGPLEYLLRRVHGESESRRIRTLMTLAAKVKKLRGRLSVLETKPTPFASDLPPAMPEPTKLNPETKPPVANPVARELLLGGARELEQRRYGAIKAEPDRLRWGRVGEGKRRKELEEGLDQLREEGAKLRLQEEARELEQQRYREMEAELQRLRSERAAGDKQRKELEEELDQLREEGAKLLLQEGARELEQQRYREMEAELLRLHSERATESKRRKELDEELDHLREVGARRWLRMQRQEQEQGTGEVEDAPGGAARD